MSRLYADGASVYLDEASGKFKSVKFGEAATGTKGFKTPAPTAGSYIPFDFGSATAMQQKAGNTLIGNMRDCGECHVGGGGMEYFPRNEGWDGTAGPDPVDNVTNSSYAWIKDTSVSYPKWIQDPAVPLIEVPDGIQDEDEYGNPLWENSPRVAYRDYVQNPAEYTSFNYFIDVFDDDNDGDLNEVLYNDFSVTGVLEVDCLMCHMEGYDWAASKAAKRAGRFDASRAAGAGFGAPATIGYLANVAQPGYGTSVVYDESLLTEVTNWAGTNLTVDLSAKLHAVPPTDNCASCHQGKYQVDWKKRGEMSASTDVHNAIGCMGCHERDDYLRGVNPLTGERDTRHLKGETVGTSLNIRDGKLGHDPAKGGAGQWDSLNNKNDWKNFKTCYDCHYYDGTNLGQRGKSFGAPNPDGAHSAAGLSAIIVQKKGTTNGVANGSHLDIISCEACHITKSSEVPHDLDEHDYFTAKGFDQIEKYASGGAFVDGTGPDHEGRLATHDTPFVSRPMYTDANGSNFGYTWAKDGKIHGGNMLTSLFYRDKNDEQLDLNVDGRPHGMDAILPTHMLKIAADNTPNPGHPGDYALLADGVSNDAEVAAQLSTIAAAMPALNGVDPTGTDGYKMKLSWVTVAFTMSHQIEPAAKAFGAGGCTDCHGNDQFYKGTIDMEGYSQFGFNGATQTTPMTKVNGMSEKTFGHPNMKDKAGLMSIPLMNNNGTALTNGSVPAGATNVIRDMDRSETLYPAVFQTRDTAFKTQLVGIDITQPSKSLGTENLKSFSTWKGWYLNVEVDEDDDNVVDSDASVWLGPSNAALGSPFSHPSEAAGTAAVFDQLFASIPTVFTDGSFTYGFDIDKGANNNIVINAEAGKEIRLAFNSFYGPFGLKGETVVAAPIIPTCKDTSLNGGFTELTGRADMVAYLDALGDLVFPYGQPACPAVVGVDCPSYPENWTNGEKCFGIGTPPPPPPPLPEEGYYEVSPGEEFIVPLPPILPGFGHSTSCRNIYDGTIVNISEGGTSTASIAAFPRAGTYQCETASINVEGKIFKNAVYVKVSAPLPGDFAAPTTSVDGVTGDITVTLNLNSTPGVYTSVLVNWKDGTAQDYFTLVEPMTNVYPAAMSGQTVVVNVAFYNGTDVVAAWAQEITLP